MGAGLAETKQVVEIDRLTYPLDMAEGDLNEMRRVSAGIHAGVIVESTI